MKVFAVCGVSNSGKTTTVERLIAELTARGHRVGSVKYIHCENFSMDADSSEDTGRHRAAGSRLISAHAKRETTLIFPERLPTEKLLRLYRGECDFVVCEGVSDIELPTIVTAHGKADLVEKWSDRVFCISGVISASIAEFRGIPAIDATKNIEGLVDLVERGVQRFCEG
ncbi:MAG: molybdopterin-guanine dinucleotide biosynthesis protein B [Clostridiales bacterium]|jgi:molybdopterin-guanine dinucleotide biosynthesis protein B|nr:molybdopterin-guanine dinucleotide biosynthesis protein B [Clostridiales bacterium]